MCIYASRYMVQRGTFLRPVLFDVSVACGCEPVLTRGTTLLGRVTELAEKKLTKPQPILPIRSRTEALIVVKENMGIVMKSAIGLIQTFNRLGKDVIIAVLKDAAYKTALYWVEKQSSFATYFLESRIKRLKKELSQMLQEEAVPMHIIEKIKSFLYLVHHMGVMPPEEEISRRFKIPAERVPDFLITVQRYIAAFGGTVEIGLDTNFEEIISATPYGGLGQYTVGASNPICLSDSPADSEEWSLIIRAMQNLPQRERRIVEMRYGLGCKEHTLEEIGRKLGISRERARQIEARAMSNIRQACGVL
jgi:RNA polymerase sigma factor (sigma-70 family)